MFGSTSTGANAYARVGIETGVLAASPHKLIVMLFDGAMISVSDAIQHMRAGNIPAKGKAISKAISIIDDGLRASLNKKAGGELALNLEALYEYMSKRLLIANLKNQPEILEEVRSLLGELKGAWVAIDPNAKAAPIAAPQPKAPVRDPLAPSSVRLASA